MNDLGRLEDEVLKEVVREAEARLGAQLQIATAADQRALTFAGFLIATATAALGAGLALLTRVPTDFTLAAVSLGFALGILAAAAIAMYTIWPRTFAIPGNEPENWLPENWASGGNDLTIKRARVEQATCLQDMLKRNAVAARTAAKRMRLSMAVSAACVAVAALLLAGTLICRASA
jgi:hypothetical protein